MGVISGGFVDELVPFLRVLEVVVLDMEMGDRGKKRGDEKRGIRGVIFEGGRGFFVFPLKNGGEGFTHLQKLSG